MEAALGAIEDRIPFPYFLVDVAENFTKILAHAHATGSSSPPRGRLIQMHLKYVVTCLGRTVMTYKYRYV